MLCPEHINDFGTCVPILVSLCPLHGENIEAYWKFFPYVFSFGHSGLVGTSEI
jgi:hypothetical protein